MRANYRHAAYAALAEVIKKPEISPIEEQDARAMLAILYMHDRPLKDFKAIEQNARRILDLQAAVRAYLLGNNTAGSQHVFDIDDPPNFAYSILGKIYLEGGHGIEQDRAAAYNYLQKVIKNRYSSRRLVNEALLDNASLLLGDITQVPVPAWIG